MINIDNAVTEKVLSYIKNNWINSIREANDAVPFPFTSPSVSGFYKDFFYWDNYFINKGLLIDGFLEQVENTLNNFAYYIDRFGYIPNASNLLDRSQPPVLTFCVLDYYEKVQDKKILKTYLPYILKEYKFWMTERILPCGLNSFGSSATKHQLLTNYKYLHERVLEERDTEEEQLELAKDILAIAESGLDFNMRFITSESKIDAGKFIHLDLNCFLYGVEESIAKIYGLLNDDKKNKEFIALAKKRKALINKYLFDKTQGIYLDYNYKSGEFSKVLSVVSFYPYVYGISGDKESAKKILDKLELPCGVSPTAFRGVDAIYYQWDYPCVWPVASWFTFIALNNVGLKDDAKRVALKYISDVNINFEKTGVIWEKYDGRDGSVARTNEYETPEMLGWSAGVYKAFCGEILK
ncbi:MAG: hypothetical protein IJQ07_06935 [Clostridia bacterium]|nr:hypothetical protein [Clostridia bacterium]